MYYSFFFLFWLPASSSSSSSSWNYLYLSIHLFSIHIFKSTTRCTWILATPTTTTSSSSFLSPYLVFVLLIALTDFCNFFHFSNLQLYLMFFSLCLPIKFICTWLYCRYVRISSRSQQRYLIPTKMHIVNTIMYVCM